MIELPFPAKILWPNGRGHHMAKYRQFQAHKKWAWTAGLHAGLQRCDIGQKVRWSVTIYPKTRNAIDRDNALASLKAYQDGLAKAMGVDDSCFDTPTLHFAEPVKNGRVVVVIG